MRIRSFVRIDRQDGYDIGGDQQRHRIVDRAGRLAAGVPADQHTAAHGLEMTGIGHDENRPPRSQYQGFSRMIVLISVRPKRSYEWPKAGWTQADF